jgi:hypothetical protein
MTSGPLPLLLRMTQEEDHPLLLLLLLLLLLPACWWELHCRVQTPGAPL